jgi:hypothetical protein
LVGGASPPVIDLRARVVRLNEIGGADRPVTSVTPDELLAEILEVLDSPHFSFLTYDERSSVLYRIHLLYAGSWHPSGEKIIPFVERVSHILFADDDAPLNALCIAYDLLFFLYWCWNTSIDQQTPFGLNVVEPFCAAIRRRRDRDAASRLTPQAKPEAQRVGYLAEFLSLGPGNAIAVANQVIMRALAASPNCQPILYAWMFHDPDILAEYRALGVDVRAITANSLAERVEILRDMIAEDAPDVLITDMNAAVPAALFEYRVAPLQVFYQFGMPVWPVSQVDAVFHCWDFDFAKAGLSGRSNRQLMIPYDLARFAGPADPESLRRERVGLPGGRLVGTYGRLSKITPAFIEAVVSGVARHPDVSVVFAGSGNGTPIRDAISAKGLTDRFIVRDHFVDGHVWGHMLDVFLDTFPQPGGASCLEVIAKGKPVVSLVTSEAANLAREQRVRSLVATDSVGYARILDRLLGNSRFYKAACNQTRRLAMRYPTEESYRASLVAAIEELRNPSRLLSQWGRFRSRLMRLGRRG